MAATRSISDLPGPRRLPLVGNAHQVRPDEPAPHGRGVVRALRPGLPLRPRPAAGRRARRRRADQRGPARPARTGSGAGARSRRPPKRCRERWGSSRRRARTGAGTRRLAVTALNSNHLQRYFEVVSTCTGRLHGRLERAAARRAALRHRRAALVLHGRRHLLARLRARPEHARARRQRAAGPPAPGLPHDQPAPVRAAALLALGQAARRPRARSLARRDRQGGHRLHGRGPRSGSPRRPELREAPENFLEGMIAAQENDARLQRRGDRRQRLHAAARRRGHDLAHDGLDDLVDGLAPGDPGEVGRGGARGPRRAALRDRVRHGRGASATARACCASRCG